MFDFNDPRGDYTQLIIDWLSSVDVKATEGLEQYGIYEALSAVFDAATNDQAAQSLSAWFSDRLLGTPGVSGPFGELSSQILSRSLLLVAWDDITAIMRDRAS